MTMFGHGIAIGQGLLLGKAKIFNDFIVHTNVDTESGISIGIEGPSNAQMRYIDNEDGSIKVSYKPMVPGYYKITVKQNGSHVKGSPFEVPVYDPSVGPDQPFYPKASFAPSHHHHHYNPHHHHTPQTIIVDPLSVHHNSTNLDHSSIPSVALGDFSSLLEEDLHGHIDGPFGNPAKVKVSGRGLFRGITNVQSEIIVDTRKAGLGRVNWTINGPGNVQTRHVHIVSGLHKLYYIADTRGLYVVKVKFNEQDVPGSPYKLRIM